MLLSFQRSKDIDLLVNDLNEFMKINLSSIYESRNLSYTQTLFISKII